MVTSRYLALVEKAYDVLNRGALDELDGLLTKNFVAHQPMPGVASAGRDAIKGWLRAWRTAFPDARFEILELSARARSPARGPAPRARTTASS